MTLGDLVKQCEGDKDVTFQINNEEYDGWDTFDEVWSYSPLLDKYLDREITCLTAIKLDVFRFTLKGE